MFNPDIEERQSLDAACRTAGIGCIECKKALYGHLERLLEPIQRRRLHFEQNEDELYDILRAGARRAQAVAEKTMEEVVGAIGFFR